MTTEISTEINFEELCINADKCGAIDALNLIELGLTGTRYNCELNNLYHKITEVIGGRIRLGSDYTNDLAERVKSYMIEEITLKDSEILTEIGIAKLTGERWYKVHSVVNKYHSYFEGYLSDRDFLKEYSYPEKMVEDLVARYGSLSQGFSPEDKNEYISLLRKEFGTCIDLEKPSSESIFIAVLDCINNYVEQCEKSFKTSGNELSATMRQTIYDSAMKKESKVMDSFQW